LFLEWLIFTDGFVGGKGTTESDSIEVLDGHRQALKEKSCLYAVIIIIVVVVAGVVVVIIFIIIIILQRLLIVKKTFR